MRKIIFTTLLLGAFFLSVATAAEPLVNLYWSGSYYAPKNMEGDVPADSSYAFSYGLKLNWDALDFRLFNSCKKTGGGGFWPATSFGDYEKIFDRRRASVALDFSKRQKVLKTKVAAGSLRLYSQKRIAPFSASASPFVSSLADSGALLASLPTKSSSPQDDSIYIAAALSVPKEWGGESVRLMPIKAEFAVTKNEADPGKAPFLASARGGFFYQNWLKATGGIFFGRRYSEERLDAAEIDWFASVPIWRSELSNLCAADFCVEIPFLKSRTTFGIAEGRDSLGKKSLGRSTLAQEFLFTMGNFSLSAAAFASDNIFCGQKTPYVAANGKEYKKLWQAKITPQIVFKPKNGPAVKIGLGGFVEEQIKDYSKKTERRSLEAKAAAGLQLSAKKDLFKLTAGLSSVTLRQIPSQEKAPPLPKISAAFYYSHMFYGPLAGRLALSGGASFQPELDWQKREWTERFKAAFYPKRGFLSCVSAGFSASQKDGNHKFEPSAAAGFLFKARAVRVNASVSAAFPLVW